MKDKYHDLDKRISARVRAQLLADGITEYQAVCSDCRGHGRLPPDDGSVPTSCPGCGGSGHYRLAV